MEVTQTGRITKIRLALGLLRRKETFLIARRNGEVYWSFPGLTLPPNSTDTNVVLTQYLLANLRGLGFAKRQRLLYSFSYDGTDEYHNSCSVQIFDADITSAKIKPNREELEQISFKDFGFITKTLFEKGALHPLMIPLLSCLSRKTI